MKLSHRIQVAMYALYLEEVFKKESITNITISTNGGVWIRPNEDYTLFDLTPVKHVLQEFLNCNNMDSKLRLILNTALHEVPYHLNKRCSGCPYLPICEGQVRCEITFCFLGLIYWRSLTTLWTCRSSKALQSNASNLWSTSCKSSINLPLKNPRNTRLVRDRLYKWPRVLT